MEWVVVVALAALVGSLYLSVHESSPHSHK